LDDAVGAGWEFTSRFAKVSRKLTRNTPGDRWRKTVRLAAGESEGYWNVGWRLYRQDFGQLSVAELPWLGG
ncbi:hypothetical protein BHE74_00008469, partial [Ensete ventricosum]